jgi:catechol 2,3-dioxygenase-like lactoylglutathione lyase family enzyme
MRFLHITPRLPVKSLSRTISFYTEHLGFVIDVVWPDRQPTFALMRRDATTVGFFEQTEHHRGAIGDVELYVEVTGAAALHVFLLPRVPIEWGPEIYAYGRREFAIRDPDHYLIIFTEPTAERPTTSEPEIDNDQSS